MYRITGESGFVGQNLKKRIDLSPQSDNLVVFHLACDGDSRGSNKKLVEHTKNNLLLFTEVLEDSIGKGLKRFIYISSSEAETEHNVYSIEKRACEKLLVVMAKEYGFEYVIVRPYTLFGEEMNIGDKNRNVIANFIKKTILGEPIEIIGDIKATRQFTYIGQLIDVLEDCITNHTNETVTVTSGIETSVEDLDYMIKNLYKTIKWVGGKIKNE